MKYLLIAIAWLFLTIYLVSERIFKVIISAFIILWDFKFIKSRHYFWNQIDLLVPFLLVPFFYPI